MVESEARLLLDPWIQKAVVLPTCTACRNDAECRAEDVFHALGFLAKVTAFSLDDANGIDPEVFEAKFTTSYDGVLKCGWEFLELNALLVCFDIV